MSTINLLKFSQLPTASINISADYVPVVRDNGSGSYDNYRVLSCNLVGSPIIVTGSADAGTSTLRCGYGNSVSGYYNGVLGGCNNNSDGEFSSILGGQNNNINTYINSFIVGSDLTATAECTTFVNNLNVGGNEYICGDMFITGTLHITGTIDFNGTSSTSWPTGSGGTQLVTGSLYEITSSWSDNSVSSSYALNSVIGIQKIS